MKNIIFPANNNSEISVHRVPDVVPEYEAVFIWNKGELNSMLDYEVPVVGRGSTEAEAIGNLMLDYDKKERANPSANRIPPHCGGITI